MKWVFVAAFAIACGGASSETAPATATPSAAPSSSAAPVASSSVAPPTDTPAAALVVVAMKLTAEKQKNAIELKDDGTISADGKVAMKFAGAELQDMSGKALMSVTSDGTLKFDGVARGAKFNEKDEVVLADGAKLFVSDDGVVNLINPDGKADKDSGKVKLAGFKPQARRAASVLVLAAFMMRPSEAQMNGTATKK